MDIWYLGFVGLDSLALLLYSNNQLFSRYMLSPSLSFFGSSWLVSRVLFGKSVALYLTIVVQLRESLHVSKCCCRTGPQEQNNSLIILKLGTRGLTSHRHPRQFRCATVGPSSL